MNQNVAEKVVVITGASSGIGEITARHLAGLGAHVVWEHGVWSAWRRSLRISGPSEAGLKSRPSM